MSAVHYVDYHRGGKTVQTAVAEASATGTQSLERAITLLQELASHGSRGARLTDLVSDTGFSKGTVRRLLATLIRQGMVEQSETSRRYFLGSELFFLGSVAASRISLNSLPEHKLHRLAALAPAKYAGSGIRLAHLLCDRHAEAGRDAPPAMLHESAAGRSSRLTYGELADYSRRFASVLRDLGVTRGTPVVIHLPKGPEYLIATLALWRLGAVQVPLFTTLGPQAIAYRLEHSGAKVIVSNGAGRAKLPQDESLRVVSVEGEGGPAIGDRDVSFWLALHAARPLEADATLDGDDPFVLLYTISGRDVPRGLPVPVRALACLEQHMLVGLDARDDDVYWNISDPGWAAGLYYAVIGPLLLGRTVLFCDGPFDVAQVYRVLVKYGVTNLLAAPGWYQEMRDAQAVCPPPSGLRLRVASSVGGALPQALVDWAKSALDIELHNLYGQAELGLAVINHHLPALRRGAIPGSIGRAMPGLRVVVLDGDGRELPPGAEGELAVDTEKSPLFWFQGYHRDAAATARRFRHGGRFYLTGDLVRIDADGNVLYLGLMDDAIHSAGYLIGPVEIERILLSHPAIAQAAVVGRPDKLLGEVARAFLVLKAGQTGSAELAREIADFVTRRVAGLSYPPEIEFVASLAQAGLGPSRLAGR